MILKFEVHVTLGSYETNKNEIMSMFQEIQSALNTQTDEIKIILKEE